MKMVVIWPPTQLLQFLFLLNDNIYVKDTGGHRVYLRLGDGVWRYSIKENTWTPHPWPKLNGFKNYKLMIYQSQLVCIGGSVWKSEESNEYIEVNGKMTTFSRYRRT